jgi:hypothetical protein
MAAEALYREDCHKVAPNQKEIASISAMMKFHPLSQCLPMLPGHELDQLAEDVRKYGLQVPITIFEDKILDGRNRYIACKKAKVKPRFEPYEGDDPVSFVMSHNFARRHLTPSQRAAYAVKIIAIGEIWASKGRPKNVSADTFTGDVAKTTGTSRSTIARAKKVLQEAPEKFEQVQKGEKTLYGATEEIKKETNVSRDTFTDALGFPVPELARPYWNRADEVKVVLHQLSKLKGWAEELHERKDPLYVEVNLSFIRVELGNIYQNLKGALPYAVCTLCQGQSPEVCDLCKGRGVISEFRWKHALPQEDRDKRQAQIEKLLNVGVSVE